MGVGGGRERRGRSRFFESANGSFSQFSGEKVIVCPSERKKYAVVDNDGMTFDARVLYSRVRVDVGGKYGGRRGPTSSFPRRRRGVYVAPACVGTEMRENAYRRVDGLVISRYDPSQRSDRRDFNRSFSCFPISTFPPALTEVLASARRRFARHLCSSRSSDCCIRHLRLDVDSFERFAAEQSLSSPYRLSNVKPDRPKNRLLRLTSKVRFETFSSFIFFVASQKLMK